MLWILGLKWMLPTWILLKPLTQCPLNVSSSNSKRMESMAKSTSGSGNTLRLRDRRQQVQINNPRSEWAPVLGGIPQGSVIGPVMFVIYINDLPNELDCPCKMFADDTKIWTVYNKSNLAPQTKSLQRSLDKADTWFTKWLLRFNTDKCKIMHISGGSTAAHLPLYTQ